MGKHKNTHGHEPTRTNDEGLIPKHGGYRNLKTFQLAKLIYDITVRFCEKYIDPRSRTYDQMIQAARSGKQNIAEGSMDSATSKKIELKLTGTAKGSLEELRQDYEDYLRHRRFPQWEPNHPVLMRFKALQCKTLMEFRRWVADEVKREQKGNKGKMHTDNTDPHGQTRANRKRALRAGVRESLCPSVYVANGPLSLINLCVYLLGNQLKAQANAFELEGGFTERLYRKRIQARRSTKD